MSMNQQDNNNNDDDDNNRQEIWFREDERWELTWPIWHMLPRAERKEIAHKHGYANIGEFEEYMTLQRAVGDSEAMTTTSSPYDNSLIYSSPQDDTALRETSAENFEEPQLGQQEDDEELDEDESAVAAERELGRVIAGRESQEQVRTVEMLQCGGAVLVLPDEILHRVFSFLPVDMYATMALVSPHWKSFTRTESVYKRLCERLYLNQSKRRALHVAKFQNSYRLMLERRPRVKTGGGVYVMKYTRVKRIQRDMWTEVPVGAILEMTYYRYLYFQENGRVLYSLTPTAPHEMFPRFRKVNLTGSVDKDIVWGTFTVQGKEVTVEAKQTWQHVKFKLAIDVAIRLHGRFGCLTFTDHISSTSGHFNDQDSVQFEVPTEPFRFVKNKRL